MGMNDEEATKYLNVSIYVDVKNAGVTRIINHLELKRSWFWKILKRYKNATSFPGSSLFRSRKREDPGNEVDKNAWRKKVSF